MPTITTTPLCTLASTTDGSSSPASSSGTPAAGETLVAFVTATGTVVNTPTLTSSANGITWELIAVIQANANANRLFVFLAEQLVPSSPSAMTVTVGGFASDQASGWIVDVQRCAGYTQVPAYQLATQANKAGATAATVTFGAACTTGNAVLAAQQSLNNPPGQTPPAGWSEFQDAGISTPTAGQHVMGRVNFTGTTVTWGATSGAGAAVAIELIPSVPVDKTGSDSARAVDQRENGGPSSYAELMLESGPLLYYRLGDTGTVMKDWSSLAKDGVITQVGGVSADAPGLLDDDAQRSLLMASTERGVGAYDAAYDGTTAVTVSAVVNPSSLPAGAALIFARQTGVVEWQLSLQSGVPRFVVNTNPGGNLGTVNAPGALTVGTTYHIVCTWSPAGTARMYIDGTEVATTARSGTSIANQASATTQVGASSSSFKGNVQECAMLPIALTAAQVLALYDMGTDRPPMAATSPAVTASSADTGTAVDVTDHIDQSSSVTDKIGSDAATAVDAGTLAVAESSADTSSSTDAGTLAVAESSADTGSGADATSSISTAEQKTGSDSAAGADATSGLVVAESSADTAAGVDASSLSVTEASADTGTSVDAGTLSVQETSGDTGTAVDAGTVAVPVTGSDSAAGTDATASLAVAESSADTASAADAGTLAAADSSADAGTAVDATSDKAVAVTGSDSATATDTGTAGVPADGFDEASGTDATLSVVASDSSTDGAAGVDASTLAVAESSADAATAADASQAPAVAVSGTDAAAATESSVVDTSEQRTGSDQCVATESSVIHVLVDSTDSGTGADASVSPAVTVSSFEEVSVLELSEMAAEVAGADLCGSSEHGHAMLAARNVEVISLVERQRPVEVLEHPPRRVRWGEHAREVTAAEGGRRVAFAQRTRAVDVEEEG